MNINIRIISVFAFTAVFSISALATSNPRIEEAIFGYEVGGAFEASPPVKVNTTKLFSMDIGQHENFTCGAWKPDFSAKNVFNGVEEGFTTMVGQTLTSAQNAIAGLPAAIVQRANPALWERIMQTMVQVELDLQYAESSCEQMQAVMLGEQGFPFDKYKLTAKAGNYEKSFGVNGSGQTKDILTANKENKKTDHGNTGVKWTCGEVKLGVATKPIKAISDVVVVGYNTIFNRLSDTCTTDAITNAVGQGNELFSYWSGPQVAANWATDVVGEVELLTCTGCEKMKSKAGKGLTYKHLSDQEIIYDRIMAMVDNISPINESNLARVSAPPLLTISPQLIYAVRAQGSGSLAEYKKKFMVRKLAGELAFARLVEQGRYMTQIMRTGLLEPNVAAYEHAVEAVENAITLINSELDEIRDEVDVREDLASKSISEILFGYDRYLSDIDPSFNASPSGIDQAGKVK